MVMVQAIEGRARQLARGAGLLALAFVAACADPPVPPEIMSDRCQLTKCVCLGKDASLLSRTKNVEPPAWTENGAPFCNPGYDLVLEADSKGYPGKGIKTYD